MSSNTQYRAMNQFSWEIPAGSSSKTCPDIPDDMALCGPGGEPGRVLVIASGGRPFESLLRELCHSLNIPEGKKGALPQHVGSPIRDWIDLHLATEDPILVSDEGFHRIVAINPRDTGCYALAALTMTPSDNFRICGLFIGENLAVDPVMSGLGIGKGLIAARLIHKGDLPTWDREDAVVNHAGEATILGGLALARRLAPAPDDTPSPAG